MKHLLTFKRREANFSDIKIVLVDFLYLIKDELWFQQQLKGKHAL